MAQITLNQAERRELITALVTNCAGWDEEDIDLLVNMSDQKIWTHAQGCAQLIANAEAEDDSGIPDSMEPESADTHEGEADEEGDEGWGSEVLDEAGSDQGEDGPEAGDDDTQDKDQPKVCHDEDGNEIECSEETAEGENVTENRYLAQLPPRIRSVVINALKFEQAQKRSLVNQITANSRNRFSEGYLMRMGVDELQALADLATPRRSQAVYTGAAGAPVMNETPVDRDDVLTIPTLEFSRN